MGTPLIGVLAVVIIVLLAWFATGRGQPAARPGPESFGGLVTTTTSGGVSETTGSDGGARPPPETTLSPPDHDHHGHCGDR